MKTVICVNINRDHVYGCDTYFIGRSGENESTQFQIKLEECLCDSWVYIDFIKPDGTKYKTPRLDIVENVVTYDVTNELLTNKGTLKAQIVLQNETGIIWKSTVKSYEIIQSIDATDAIPDKEDFIHDAQTLLNEIENGLTPTIGENGNWFVGDKDTGKPSKGQDGEIGASNTLTIGEVAKGDEAQATITGESPNQILNLVLPKGDTGAAFTYDMFTEEQLENLKGKDGVDGKDGTDGVSPLITATQTESGATITITDKNGTTSTNLTNGKDGVDGKDGIDGVSPTITATQTNSGATITITDKNGTTTANLTNGKDGTDGVNGIDGISPLATVTQTVTGATITIEDKNGTTTANLMNGKDGKDGEKGEAFTYEDFTEEQLNSLKGKDGANGTDGKDGESGVYLGATEPTNDANVWINPEEGSTEEYATKEYVNNMLGVIENGSY